MTHTLTDEDVQKLRAALEFYADRNNYINGDDGNKYVAELEKLTGERVCMQITDAAGQDCGEKARNALALLSASQPTAPAGGVSLEGCAREPWSLPPDVTPSEAQLRIAKAVLDYAGVKYV